MDLTAAMPIRIARPSADLGPAERFWTQGVGLSLLWRTDATAEGGHPLLMVGLPDAGWHLELVEDPHTLAAHPPSAEDLLVVYLGEAADPAFVDRLVAAGGSVVAARNPYWDRYAVTVRDPDGYLLVLSRRTWASS